jgi:hypothetical protein
MAEITGAVNLTGMIAPTDTNDVYPTHASIYSKGGYREVADEAARFDIPTQRRTHGMLVYQQDTESVWQLGAGLTNGDWIDYTTALNINELVFSSFIGNGVIGVFTLPYTVAENWQILVYIDGVVQEPTNAYYVTNDQLTLATPLASGSVMNIIRLASNSSVSTISNADTLDGNDSTYYLDYSNFTNTPSNVSEFTNDSGYITLSDIPTNHMVNDATNTISGSINPSVDATYNLGTASEQWNTIYGHTVEATYADLAERYSADATYEPGTVLVFGGEAEVTTTTKIADRAVAGIISTEPAYLMNSKAGNSQTHPAIALKGRVPCKVVGVVKKGDLLVTSSVPGYAQAALDNEIKVGTVIGKAIENKSGIAPGIIEVFVSMM